MRKHVRAAFDESHQRFGANKIAAVLSEQGIRISPKYAAELMREMGLQNVTLYSKRDHQKRERLSQRQNILQRQFQADAPDRAWVSDVACVKINKNYLLSLRDPRSFFPQGCGTQGVPQEQHLPDHLDVQAGIPAQERPSVSGISQ